MATKFLDYTGLGYFCSKIKAWCNATFAAITHNHASNAVNVMTGYSKPNSTSAITTSDTLNQAIGKLEKAIDDADISNVVHITGREVITGEKVIKNLGNWITEGNATSSRLIFNNSLIDRTTDPVNSSYESIVFLDKNSDIDLDYSNRLGVIEYCKFPENTSSNYGYFNIKYYDPETTDSTISSELLLGKARNGTCFARVTETPDSGTLSNNDILTRNWIPKDTRIVHTTGNETISGNKSFSNTIIGNTYYAFKRDVNNQRTIFTGGTDDGNSSGGLLSLYGKDYSNNNGGFGLVARKDANTAAELFGYANGHLEWNGESLYNLVHRSGNETINGYKTFSSSIYANEGVIIEASAVIDSVSQTHKIKFNINNASLNAGVWDYTHDKWVWFISPSGVSSFYGNSSTATKLATARNLQVALGSTTAVTFDGSNNQNSIPVSGTLAVANGGTGLTSLNTFVRTTGDQTVAGVKTFSSSPVVARSNPYIIIKDTDFTKGNNSNCYTGLLLNSNDSSNDSACRVLAQSDSSSQMALVFYAHKNISGSTASIIIELLTGDNHYFMPRGSDNNGIINLGGGSNKWKQLYATTTTISTSDERMKDSINSVSDTILDAWEDIEWYTFKYKDAIKEKGIEKARIHNGLIAQRVIKTFKKYGLDASKYGFYCYDKWDDRYETVPEVDEQGNETGKKIQKLLTKAGNQYSIRYEEALCMEAAYQRRKNKILENRISELERQVSDMLQILQSLKGAN